MPTNFLVREGFNLLVRMLVHAIHYAVERLGFTEIKSLQLEVVLAIATGQDVFGVLPTGYGKSLCYVCLPILREHPP